MELAPRTLLPLWLRRGVRPHQAAAVRELGRWRGSSATSQRAVLSPMPGMAQSRSQSACSVAFAARCSAMAASMAAV